MNQPSFVVSLGLVAGLAAALSAQRPSSNGQTDQKTIHSIRVKVIGCVAHGSQTGHYRLTNAVLSGDDTQSTGGLVGKAGSGRDVSFENSPSFELIGDDLKAFMGDKIEVIGITSDTKLNNRDAFQVAIGSSTHGRATLTVSSVKRISAKCP